MGATFVDRSTVDPELFLRRLSSKHASSYLHSNDLHHLTGR